MPGPGKSGGIAPPKQLAGVSRVRKSLLENFPAFFERALEGYKILADADLPVDPKAASAHYGACKAALSHLEIIFKLCKLAELDSSFSDSGKEAGPDLEALLENAQAALDLSPDGN